MNETFDCKIAFKNVLGKLKSHDQYQQKSTNCFLYDIEAYLSGLLLIW